MRGLLFLPGVVYNKKGSGNIFNQQILLSGDFGKRKNRELSDSRGKKEKPLTRGERTIMKFEKVFFYLMIFIFCTSVSALAQYPESVQKALEVMDEGDLELWAYTIKTEMLDKTVIEHFDPSKPDGEQWQLISVNGQNPSADEMEEYNDRKKKERERQESKDQDEQDEEKNGKTISLGLNKMIDQNGLTLIKKESGLEEYSFQPLAEKKDDDEMMKYLTGTLIIDTKAQERPYIEQLILYSQETFSPAFSVKISRFRTDMRFQAVHEGGPIFPHTIKTEIEGKAMIFKKIDEKVTVTYSEYEYRGPAEKSIDPLQETPELPKKIDS